MTTTERNRPDLPDPLESMRKTWEAGQQSLAESWAQTQDFWNSVARNWGEAAGAWLRQPPGGQPQETSAVLRELSEATFAAGEAWLRLPLLLVGGVTIAQLQKTASRLTEAHARALRLWLDTVTSATRAPETRR
jgi:hypothetical protein